jgi:nucleoside-triphosphatase
LTAAGNLLITGRPGVGKTTLLLKALELSGLKARGFYTEEIREGGQRRGFRVRTFGGGECVFSHTGFKGKPRVGRYGVDVEGFEATALPELEEALGGGGLIVIDEIGKMELLSDRFKDMVHEALESKNSFLGVVKEKGNGFIRGIKTRADVALYTITMENRDRALEVVLSALRDIGQAAEGDIRI